MRVFKLTTMMTMKKFRLVALIVVLGLGASAFRVADNNNYFEILKNIEIFTNLYKEVNTNYVDDIDPGKLMRTGLEAMVGSLDPFTNYIPESRIEQFRFAAEGKYRGIGATVRKKGEELVITDLYEDSPANRSGLRAGDRILAVDGKSTRGKNPSEVNEILQGFPGSEVSLTVLSYGSEKPREVALVRGEVNVPNVPHSGMVSERVGYINLTTFTRDAGRNVQKALRDLQRDHPDMEGVILDLRDNGGGLLTEAVNVVNTFVPKGELVVSMRGKLKERNRDFKTMSEAVDTDIRVAVLINHKSASASEIVSGALQDLDRGVLLGQRSYGKGLVQNTMDVGYNSQLKVTTAKYYIPSGRCIQSVEYQNGEPVQIPDEERSRFKTRGGRTVLDGGGVKPDVLLEEVREVPVIKALDDELLIVEFASRYCAAVDSIGDARDFVFDDFEAFVSFLRDSDFHFESAAEKQLKAFEVALSEEAFNPQVEAELEVIYAKLNTAADEALLSRRNEILRLVQQEIVSRFYFHKGRVENGLNNDPQVIAAIEVLSDTTRYGELLKP